MGSHPGTNTVSVHSVDFAGNLSAFVTRKFFYDVPAVFALDISGPGNVKGAPHRRHGAADLARCSTLARATR